MLMLTLAISNVIISKRIEDYKNETQVVINIVDFTVEEVPVSGINFTNLIYKLTLIHSAPEQRVLEGSDSADNKRFNK